MIFPSKKIAGQCETFIHHRAAVAGIPASVRYVHHTIHPEGASAQASQCAELHIIFFHINLFPCAMEFWEYTGLGISSRFAEHCLSLLPDEDKENLESVREIYQASGTAASPDQSSKNQSTHVEERSGGDPSLDDGALAKQILRRRIAGAITTGKVQVGLCNGAQDIEVGRGGRGVRDVSEDDVFLFSTGMAAIWKAYNICLEARGQMKSVVFG